MTVPLLSELREPPVVGRYYMVPTVEWSWNGRRSHWPVIGPMHEDAEFFGFPHLHYHLDGRFLNQREESAITLDCFTLEERIGGTVLHDNPAWKLLLPRGLPKLRRRRCTRPAYGYAHHDKAPVQKIKAKYGDPVEPRRLADGRVLCPHRKVDLSSFPPDADGIVVCPLHGLRVRCGVSA